MYRTNIPGWMKDLLPELSKECQRLVARTASAVTPDMRDGNLRGRHYFNIMGAARQNTNVSACVMPLAESDGKQGARILEMGA